MMDKFQNKYRIGSHRLKGWDYSSGGYYFVTIVIQNRECILGQIENQKIILSDFGEIVKTEFYQSFNMRAELFLDEFIIMPNHIHALILLNRSIGIVETHGRASLQSESQIPQRKPKSISSFVAGFKSATISKIDDLIDLKNLPIPKYNSQNKLWQSNYHDHIVRDAKEYWKIKNYIRNNPAKWVDDKLFE